jgi:hypothetical protein
MRRGLFGVLALLLAGLAWTADEGMAQENPTPAGHWEGAIVVPGGELGIDVDLMEEDGSWTGDISIPVQQTQDFVLSDVIVDGFQVSFLMAGVPGDPTFSGILSEDGETITGTFSQGGQVLEFTLTRSG